MCKNNKKYIAIIIIIVVTILSLIQRLDGIEVISKDFAACLEPWFQILKDNGGILGLKLELGDYNIPYMVILALLTYLPIEPIISIKVVSIIFDYILASVIAVLILKLMKENKNKYIYAIMGYSITTLLPTVILNSAYWAQCDSIYASFAIISLIYLIDEKYIRSFIFLGISFAFKLQAVFLLPVYVLVYISKRKYQIYHFAIIPLINCIMCLPAILCGRALSSSFGVYLRQTGSYNNRISLNFPGIYNIIYNNADEENVIYVFHKWLPKVMIVLMMCIFATMALYVIVKKIKFNKKAIINTAIWSILLATYILPYMHERYLYVAEVLSVICFIANRNKERLCYGNFTVVFSMHIYGFSRWNKFNTNSFLIMS